MITIFPPGSLPASDNSWPDGPTRNYAIAPDFNYWFVAGGTGDEPPDPTWTCAVSDRAAIVESRQDGNRHVNEVVYTFNGSDTQRPEIWNSTEASTSGTALTFPTPTTTIGNALVCLIAIQDAARSVVSVVSDAENFTLVPASKGILAPVTALGTTTEAWVLGSTAVHSSVTITIDSSAQFSVGFFEVNAVDVTQLQAVGSSGWGSTAYDYIGPYLTFSPVGQFLGVLCCEETATNITSVAGPVATQTWNLDFTDNGGGSGSPVAWADHVGAGDGGGTPRVMPQFTLDAVAHWSLTNLVIGGVPDVLNFTLPDAPVELSSLYFSLAPVLTENDVAEFPSTPPHTGVIIAYDNSGQVLPQIIAWSCTAGVISGHMNSSPTIFGIGKRYIIGACYKHVTSGSQGVAGFADSIVELTAIIGGGFFPDVQFTFITPAPPDVVAGTNSGMYFLPLVGEYDGAGGQRPQDPYPPMPFGAPGTTNYLTGEITLSGYWINGQKIYATYGGHAHNFGSFTAPWTNTTALSSGSGAALSTVAPLTYDAMYGATFYNCSQWLTCRNWGFSIPANASIQRVMFAWEGSCQPTASTDVVVGGQITGNAGVGNFFYVDPSDPSVTRNLDRTGFTVAQGGNYTIYLVGECTIPGDLLLNSVNFRGTSTTLATLSPDANNLYQYTGTVTLAAGGSIVLIGGTGKMQYGTLSIVREDMVGAVLGSAAGTNIPSWGTGYLDLLVGSPNAYVQQATNSGLFGIKLPQSGWYELTWTINWTVGVGADDLAFYIEDPAGNAYVEGINIGGTSGTTTFTMACKSPGAFGNPLSLFIRCWSHNVGQFNVSGGSFDVSVTAKQIQASSSTDLTAGNVGVLNVASLVGNQVVRVPYTQCNGDISYGYWGNPTGDTIALSTYGASPDFWEDGFIHFHGGVGPEVLWPGSIENDGTTHETCCSEPWNEDYLGERSAGALVSPGFSTYGTDGTVTRLTPAQINNAGFGCAFAAFNGEPSPFSNGDGSPLDDRADLAVHAVRMAIYYTLNDPKVQIVGGNFQDAESNALALGYLVFELMPDEETGLPSQIPAGLKVTVALDSTGNVASVPAQYLMANDQLSITPSRYKVIAYTPNGAQVWGPHLVRVLSSPNPFDIGTWLP